MDVLELKPQDNGEWDDYVHSSPLASPFHLSGWQWVFEEIFNLKSHYLLAKEGDQILGVLPLLVIDSRLTGRHVTSMPGGIRADNQQAAADLFTVAKDLTRSQNAGFLILRDSPCKWNLPGLVTNADHCTFILRLDDGPGVIWKKLNRKVRQRINKAIKANIEVVNGQDHLETYYPAYSKAMRDLGTPTLGKRFFKKVMAQFPTGFDVLMVRLNHQVLGGGFIAYFDKVIFNTWGGMLRKYYNLNSNYLLYWQLIKLGCREGFHQVDLGRCMWDSGGYTFKKQWTADPQPLYQQFYLNTASKPPAIGGSRAKSLNYQMFVKVWRSLPLTMTEILGPWLRKRIPFG